MDKIPPLQSLVQSPLRTAVIAALLGLIPGISVANDQTVDPRIAENAAMVRALMKAPFAVTPDRPQSQKIKCTGSSGEVHFTGIRTDAFVHGPIRDPGPYPVSTYKIEITVNGEKIIDHATGNNVLGVPDSLNKAFTDNNPALLDTAINLYKKGLLQISPNDITCNTQ